LVSISIPHTNTPMGRKERRDTTPLLMLTSSPARPTLMVITPAAVACRGIPQLTLLLKFAGLSFSLAAPCSCCPLYSKFWLLYVRKSQSFPRHARATPGWSSETSRLRSTTSPFPLPLHVLPRTSSKLRTSLLRSARRIFALP